MSNRNKAKGSRFEADVRDLLAQMTGQWIERMPAGATLDRGDLVGLDQVAVECKNTSRLELATFVDEAVAEAANVGPDVLPLAVIKRRQRPTVDAYAVMPLDAWVRLYMRGRP